MFLAIWNILYPSFYNFGPLMSLTVWNFSVIQMTTATFCWLGNNLCFFKERRMQILNFRPFKARKFEFKNFQGKSMLDTFVAIWLFQTFACYTYVHMWPMYTITLWWWIIETTRDDLNMRLCKTQHYIIRGNVWTWVIFCELPANLLYHPSDYNETNRQVTHVQQV